MTNPHLDAIRISRCIPFPATPCCLNLHVSSINVDGFIMVYHLLSLLLVTTCYNLQLLITTFCFDGHIPMLSHYCCLNLYFSTIVDAFLSPDSHAKSSFLLVKSSCFRVSSWRCDFNPLCVDEVSGQTIQDGGPKIASSCLKVAEFYGLW